LLRLNNQSAQSIDARVDQADYDRSQPPKVIHLGVGAFHRAHQADYFDRLNSQLDSPWLIIGASLRNPRAAEQLNPQNGLFLHVARAAKGETTRINRAITRVINAYEVPSELASAIASPDVQLITLTITEKGYCLDSLQQALDTGDDDVIADCQDLSEPRTAIGHLIAGLKARHGAGAGPVTILSCDNLSHNGDCTKRAVLAIAEHHSTDLRRWIEENVTFPNAVVDRIAPAVTDEDYLHAQAILGLSDRGLAITEQFSQWVIEDNFAAARPPLERVGVTWVNQASAWEKRKLRLLNAAHSALAYIAGGAGELFVHSAIVKSEYRELVAALWSEVALTLDGPDDFDRETYCTALIERFSKPHLNHYLQQIALDGSQKLPPRILAPLRERLAQGIESPTLTAVVAAWCRWLSRNACTADATLKDPLLGPFSDAWIQGDSHSALVDTIIHVYPPLGELIAEYPVWGVTLQEAVGRHQ